MPSLWKLKNQSSNVSQRKKSCSQPFFFQWYSQGSSGCVSVFTCCLFFFKTTGFGYARGIAGARAMEQDLLEAAARQGEDSEILRNNAPFSPGVERGKKGQSPFLVQVFVEFEVFLYSKCVICFFVRQAPGSSLAQVCGNLNGQNFDESNHLHGGVLQTSRVLQGSTTRGVPQDHTFAAHNSGSSLDHEAIFLICTCDNVFRVRQGLRLRMSKVFGSQFM